MTTSVGHPRASARAAWGSVGPRPLPPCTGGFQFIARSVSRTRSSTSGWCIGLLDFIRSEAYFRLVLAIVSEWIFRRNPSRHSTEQ